MKDMYRFNLTSFIVLVSILIIGLLVIWFFSRREQKRLEKKERNRYPNAVKYSKDVDWLLDLDESEKFYHN